MEMQMAMQQDSSAQQTLIPENLTFCEEGEGGIGDRGVKLSSFEGT